MPGPPTPYYGFPVPAVSDPANAPHDFQALAQKIEDTLKNGYTIPSGNLTIGDQNVAAGYYTNAIYVQRLVGTKLSRITIGCVDENIPLGIELYTNNTYRGRIDFDGTGPAIGVVDPASVRRPIPFAVSTGRVACTAPGANAGVSLAITFPASRFTVAPVVTVTGETNGYTAASMGAASTTGCLVRMYNPTAASPLNPFLSWHAIQLLPTGNEAPYLAGVQTAPTGEPHVLTCHTQDCLNEDVPIELTYEDDVDAVHCGVCTQPITDIASA